MTKNSRLLLHTLVGSIGGSYNDIQVDIEEMNRLNDKIIDIITQNSTLSKAKVVELIKRDKYISADEALKLGLIDGIIKSLK